jgi:hypothetical protein
MKKLSIIIAAGSLALATPVFACPGHDDSGAPKTAEKTPSKDEKGTTDKAKESPKAPAKDTSTAKAPAKQQPKDTKKPDKVSQK